MPTYAPVPEVNLFPQGVNFAPKLSTTTGGTPVDPNLANKSGKVDTSALPSGTAAPSGASSYSPANSGISSSSSAGLATKTEAAVTGATTPPPVPIPPNENEQMLMDYYKTDIKSIRGRFPDTFSAAEAAAPVRKEQESVLRAKQTEQAKKDQADADYATEAGKQDQEWAQYLQKIETQKKGAVSQANALSYAANPYAATGSTTGEINQTIDTNYNTLTSNAKMQYDYAKEMLRQGKGKEYAAAKDNLDKTIEESKGNTIASLNTLGKQRLTEQGQEFAQSRADVDDFRANMTALNITPTQIDSMVESGDITKDLTFLSGIKANQSAFDNDPMGTAQAVISTMRKGSLAQQRVAQAALNAQNLQSYRDSMLAIAIQKMSKGGTDSYVALNTPEGNVFKNAANFAMSTGFKSGDKEDNFKVIDNLLANNDVNGAKEFIVKIGTDGLPTAEQTQVRGRYAAVKALDNIQTALDGLKEKGVNPNLYTGTLETIAQKLGVSQDPDVAYAKSMIDTAMYDYRRSMSGLAFPASETKAYKAIYPSISNVSSLNTAKLNALRDTMNSNNSVAISSIVGPSSYNTLFGGDVKTPPKAPATTGFTASFGGKTYSFKSAADLAGFKKDMNIK